MILLLNLPRHLVFMVLFLRFNGFHQDVTCSEKKGRFDLKKMMPGDGTHGYLIVFNWQWEFVLSIRIYTFYPYLDWKIGYFGLLLPFKVHQVMEFGLTQVTVDLTPTSPVLSIGYVRNNEHLGSAKNPSSDTATQVARKCTKDAI